MCTAIPLFGRTDWTMGICNCLGFQRIGVSGQDCFCYNFMSLKSRVYTNIHMPVFVYWWHCFCVPKLSPRRKGRSLCSSRFYSVGDVKSYWICRYQCLYFVIFQEKKILMELFQNDTRDMAKADVSFHFPNPAFLCRLIRISSLHHVLWLREVLAGCKVRQTTANVSVRFKHWSLNLCFWTIC